MSDLEGLVRHAQRVRAAIAAVPPEQRTPPLRRFPAGSCGEASLLLGAYLADQGIKGFEYILGARGDKREDNWCSHAWLQRGTCVVDITADQFEDAPAGIVVADPSTWHASFCIEGAAQPADFRVYSGPSLLRVMYGRMLRVL